MYSACLFCQHDLGRNQSIEAFPVGRRLAYDAATGRLWVVCGKCARWNLTPLDERWEAIEQAERLFRATRLRASTDNIGMARLPDGAELVRVGKPLRPELAAWRYGRAFERRRRRHAVGAIGIATVGAGLVSAFPWVVGLAPLLLVGAPLVGIVRGSIQRIGMVRVPDEKHPVLVRGPDLKHALLVADGTDEWGLTITGSQAREEAEWWQPGNRRVERTLRGDAARWAAATLLPRMNSSLGKSVDVRDAVELLGRSASPLDVFATAARDMRWRFRHAPPIAAETLHLDQLPRAVRLAMEMASHEESERRAMEGELEALERAWRDADAIARIADDLLLPAGVGQALARLRGGPDAPEGGAGGGTRA